MRKLFYILAIVLFINSLQAQISDNLQLSFSQLQFHNVDSFTQVSFEDGVFSGEIGTPQIPYWEVRYVIPFDQKVDSIVINNASFQTLNGNYLLYPIQPIYAFNEPIPAFVEPDTAVYNLATPYPAVRVEIAGHVFEKGYHIAILHIYPLSYTPALGELELCTSIAFTLQLTNSDEQISRPRFQSESMQYIIRNHIAAMVRNPQDIEDIFPQPQQLHGSLPASTYFQSDLPDYLIITNNTDVNGNAVPKHNGKSMTETFQELADWKTQKGVSTVVVFKFI